MNIKKQLRKIDWFDARSALISHGYANGYVGVPPEHPWHGKDYDSIDADVHGRLTYGDDHFPGEVADGTWWIGFDTIHDGDNAINCDQAYCEAELEKLYQQAVEASKLI